MAKIQIMFATITLCLVAAAGNAQEEATPGRVVSTVTIQESGSVTPPTLEFLPHDDMRPDSMDLLPKSLQEDLDHLRRLLDPRAETWLNGIQSQLLMTLITAAPYAGPGREALLRLNRDTTYGALLAHVRAGLEADSSRSERVLACLAADTVAEYRYWSDFEDPRESQSLKGWSAVLRALLADNSYANARDPRAFGGVCSPRRVGRVVLDAIDFSHGFLFLEGAGMVQPPDRLWDRHLQLWPGQVLARCIDAVGPFLWKNVHIRIPQGSGIEIELEGIFDLERVEALVGKLGLPSTKSGGALRIAGRFGVLVLRELPWPWGDGNGRVRIEGDLEQLAGRPGLRSIDLLARAVGRNMIDDSSVLAVDVVVESGAVAKQMEEVIQEWAQGCPKQEILRPLARWPEPTVTVAESGPAGSVRLRYALDENMLRSVVLRLLCIR